MSRQPLVSILLLSMNHELFIEQCIKSLTAQTYKNIEVIYLDNASSDNTFEKGKKLLEESGLSHQCFSNKESQTISRFSFLVLRLSFGVSRWALLRQEIISEKAHKINHLSTSAYSSTIELLMI